jgi:lipopolysaccharide transport system permease protein
VLLLGFNAEDIRLIFNLFKMRIRDRYMGSSLGTIWAILHPLFLLGTYTFVFGFVLKSKIPGSDTTLSYAIWMISGFVPYLAFSDAVIESSTSVVGSASLVKNIVFKSETIPVAATLTAAVPFTVGMLFLMILLFLDGQEVTWHAVALVPVVCVQFAFLVGVALFFSATTVFVRDIAQILPTVIMLLLFFTPIFYPIEAMPGIIQKLSFWNPLYQIVHPYSDILLRHQLPEWRGMAYLLGLSVVLILSGLRYFRFIKGYFEMKL